MASEQPSKDHWSPQAYTAAASFVPQLTTTVVKYLDPKPGDTILDLGCGDGVLTSQLATAVAPEGRVFGVDASESMISGAASKYATSNLSFQQQDVTAFSPSAREQLLDGSWDKVFSNAALHWILRKRETRTDVVRAAYEALKPGGVFVFELGGHGNVADVRVGLTAALVMQGVSVEEAREVSPWFFPSEEGMRGLLEGVGFAIERLELEYRPTRMTEKEDGGTGLEGWVRLMAAVYVERAREKERYVRDVLALMEEVVTREGDGSQWLGYVRLRGVARKA
ncbi:methyltransferase [Trichodelitschia bisporula]|uniref:Methyltransferase n=1 Tax=Trichodelitschia bisporula TaxID=703511 RepID=A0A6G1I764_9PEZI|nr:methyltransferase [Trichodelitschia bisporula]